MGPFLRSVDILSRHFLSESSHSVLCISANTYTYSSSCGSVREASIFYSQLGADSRVDFVGVGVQENPSDS